MVFFDDGFHLTKDRGDGFFAAGRFRVYKGGRDAVRFLFEQAVDKVIGHSCTLAEDKKEITGKALQLTEISWPGGSQYFLYDPFVISREKLRQRLFRFSIVCNYVQVK